MSIIRFEENPLIVPGDVKPSRSDFEVVCAFNAGCIRFNDEILLLMRVAERPPIGPDYVIAPILHPEDPSQGIDLFRVDRSNPAFEEIDSRLFSYKGKTYLTSISHLRIARSKDGQNFIIDERPAIFPEMRDEEYGVEDPRITQLGDKYYINYTAVSGNGITTALAVTKDFVRFERRGVIFAPENRDVTIFPEKIGGRYVCYHRPVAKLIGGADIWLAGSPDLINWGNHQHVCGPRSGMWDEYKIGGGAVPIKTEKGWLEIYHGADKDQRYCLGVMLTDLDNPGRVIGRSSEPLVEPEMEYEKAGFFGQVIFTCGTISDPDGRVVIYYGAADEYICAAETTVDDLISSVI